MQFIKKTIIKFIFKKYKISLFYSSNYESTKMLTWSLYYTSRIYIHRYVTYTIYTGPSITFSLTQLPVKWLGVLYMVSNYI